MSLSNEKRFELLRRGLRQCGTMGLRRLLAYIETGGALALDGDIYNFNDGYG